MSGKRSDDKNKFERDPTNETELRREARRQRAIERLGTKNPACIYCGENDSLVLERHHLAGRDYDEGTVIVCRNHHRKLSDRQKDHPDKIAETPDALEVIAHFLLGLADLFEFLIGKLREFASQLIERADPNRDNVEPAQP
jgi:hypothetical protein